MGDRSRRRCGLVALVIVGTLLAACGGDSGSSSPTTAVPLDGTPHYPDAEGVVVDIAADFSTLTLDGDRTYRIQKDVQSFSALDGSTQQLLRRKGQYVQVGLRDGAVRWIAGIAALVGPRGEQVVYFTGNLVELRKDKVVFEDGTVLTLADGVTADATAGVRLRATIDPSAHRVIDLRAT